MGVVATVQEAKPVLPAGIYPAEFVDISEETPKEGAASFGSDTYWLWTFVAYHKGEEVKITATSSPKLTPKTKATKWLFGLMGRQLTVGEEVDFDALKGNRCQLSIVISDDGSFSRVDAVLPPASA